LTEIFMRQSVNILFPSCAGLTRASRDTSGAPVALNGRVFARP
jgi:hypothetical protein